MDGLDVLLRARIQHGDFEAYRRVEVVLVIPRQDSHQLVGRVGQVMAVREVLVGLLCQGYLIVRKLEKSNEGDQYT